MKNTVKLEDQLTAEQLKDFSKALDILYYLEDRTEYKNKNISKAINALQKEL